MGVKYYQFLKESASNKFIAFNNLLESANEFVDLKLVKKIYNKTFTYPPNLMEGHIFVKRLKCIENIKDLKYETDFETKLLKIAEEEIKYFINEADNVIRSDSPNYIKEFLYYILFLVSSPAVSYYLIKNPEVDILFKNKIDLLVYKIESLINNNYSTRETLLKESEKITKFYRRILLESSAFSSNYKQSTLKKVIDRIFNAIISILKFIADLFSRIFNQDMREVDEYVSSAPPNVKRFVKFDSDNVYKDIISEINKVYENNTPIKNIDKSKTVDENVVEKVSNILNNEPQKIYEFLLKVEKESNSNVVKEFSEFLKNNNEQYVKNNVTNKDPDEIAKEIINKIKNNEKLDEIEKKVLSEYIFSSKTISKTIENDNNVINEILKDEKKEDTNVNEKITEVIIKSPPDVEKEKTNSSIVISNETNNLPAKIIKKKIFGIDDLTRPNDVSIDVNAEQEKDESENTEDKNKSEDEEKKISTKPKDDNIYSILNIKDFSSVFVKIKNDLNKLDTSSFEKIGMKEQIIKLYQEFKKMIVTINNLTGEENILDSINSILSEYKQINFDSKNLLNDILEESFPGGLKNKLEFLKSWILNDKLEVPVNEIKAATTNKPDIELIPNFYRKYLLLFIIRFIGYQISFKITRATGSKEYVVNLFDLILSKFIEEEKVKESFSKILDLLTDITDTLINLPEKELKIQTKDVKDRAEEGDDKKSLYYTSKSYNITNLLKNLSDKDREKINSIINDNKDSPEKFLDEFRTLFNNLKYGRNEDAVFEFYKQKSFILLTIFENLSDKFQDIREVFQKYKNTDDFRELVEYITEFRTTINLNDVHKDIIKNMLMNPKILGVIFGFYNENKINLEEIEKNKEKIKPEAVFPDTLSSIMRNDNITRRVKEKIDKKSTYYYKLSSDTITDKEKLENNLKEFKNKISPLVDKARELIKEENIPVNNLLIEFYRGLIYFHHKRFEQLYPQSPVLEKIKKYSYGYKYFPSLTEINNYIEGKETSDPAGLNKIIKNVTDNTKKAWRIIETKLGDSNRTISEINIIPHKKLKKIGGKDYTPTPPDILRREISKILWALYSYYMLTKVFNRFNEEDTDSILSDFNSLYKKCKQIIDSTRKKIPITDLEDEEIKYFDNLIIKIEREELNKYKSEIYKINDVNLEQFVNIIKNIKRIILNDKNKIVLNKNLKIKSDLYKKLDAINLTEKQRSYFINFVDELFIYLTNPSIYINEIPNINNNNLNNYKAALVLILQNPEIYGIILNNVNSNEVIRDYKSDNKDLYKSITYNFAKSVIDKENDILFNKIISKVEKTKLDTLLADRTYFMNFMRKIADEDINFFYKITAVYHMAAIESVNNISEKNISEFNVVFDKKFSPSNLEILEKYFDAKVQETGIQLNLKVIIDELYSIIAHADITFLEDLIKNTVDDILISSIKKVLSNLPPEQRIFIQTFYHYSNDKIDAIQNIEELINKRNIGLDNKLKNIELNEKYKEYVEDVISKISTPKVDLYDEIKKILNYLLNMIDKNNFDYEVKILYSKFQNENLPKTNKELFEILFTKYIGLLKIIFDNKDKINIAKPNKIVEVLKEIIKREISKNNQFLTLTFDNEAFIKNRIQTISAEIKNKIVYADYESSIKILNNLLESTPTSNFAERVVIVYLIIEKIYSEIEYKIDEIDIKEVEKNIVSLGISPNSSNEYTEPEEVLKSEENNENEGNNKKLEKENENNNIEYKEKENNKISDLEDLDKELERIKNLSPEEKAKMFFSGLEKLKNLSKENVEKENNFNEDRKGEENKLEEPQSKENTDDDKETKNEKISDSGNLDSENLYNLIQNKLDKFLFVKILNPSKDTMADIKNNILDTKSANQIYNLLYEPIIKFYSKLKEEDKNKLIENVAKIISETIAKSGGLFVIRKFYKDGDSRIANKKLYLYKLFLNKFKVLSQIKNFPDAPKFNILYNELKNEKDPRRKENEVKFEFIYKVLKNENFWKSILKIFFDGTIKKLNYTSLNKIATFIIIVMFDKNAQLVNDKMKELLYRFYKNNINDFKNLEIKISEESKSKKINESFEIMLNSYFTKFLLEQNLSISNNRINYFLNAIFLPIYNAVFKSVVYKQFLKLFTKKLSELFDEFIIKRKDFYTLYIINPKNNRIRSKITIDLRNLYNINPDKIYEIIKNGRGIETYNKLTDIISKTSGEVNFKEYMFKILNLYNRSKTISPELIKSMTNVIHRIIEESSKNIQLIIN